MTYSIDDGNGNQLTTGLQEHEAHASAQRLADERGEPVYLYSTEGGVQSRYEMIEPTEGDEGDADDERAQAEHDAEIAAGHEWHQDPQQAQLDALRSRAINDVTRAIMATGITLTFGDVDDLGDETLAWIGSRLGLSVTTTDRGVECRVTR